MADFVADTEFLTADTVLRKLVMDRILLIQNRDYVPLMLNVAESLLSDSYIFTVKAIRKDFDLQWVEAEQANYWGE